MAHAHRKTLLSAAILAAASTPVGAATIIVDGVCTLDAAIISANADVSINGCAAGSGHDTIYITTNVALTAQAPRIRTSMTLIGSATSPPRIVAGPSARLFFIGDETSGPAVTFRNLSLENGNARGGDGVNGGGGGAGLGGAIFVFDGNVTLRNVGVFGNSAAGGTGTATAGIQGGGGGGGMNANGGTAGAPNSDGGAGQCELDAGNNGVGGGGGGGGTFNEGGGGFGGCVPLVSPPPPPGQTFNGGGNGGNAAFTGGPAGAGFIGSFGGGGGGGGGGGFQLSETSGAGGDGGFGGGGGAGGGAEASGGNGGDGGFGGGGGAGGVREGGSGTGGQAGFGGGATEIATAGGGAGFGGAVFVRAGQFTAIGSRFSENGASQGVGPGGSGQAKGGALYVLSTMSNGNGNDAGFPDELPVAAGCDTQFQTSQAADALGTDTDNVHVFGTNILGLTGICAQLFDDGFENP